MCVDSSISSAFNMRIQDFSWHVLHSHTIISFCLRSMLLQPSMLTECFVLLCTMIRIQCSYPTYWVCHVSTVWSFFSIGIGIPRRQSTGKTSWCTPMYLDTLASENIEQGLLHMFGIIDFCTLRQYSKQLCIRSLFLGAMGSGFWVETIDVVWGPGTLGRFFKVNDHTCIISPAFYFEYFPSLSRQQYAMGASGWKWHPWTSGCAGGSSSLVWILDVELVYCPATGPESIIRLAKWINNRIIR